MKSKLTKRLVSMAALPFMCIPLIHAQGIVFETPEQNFGEITTDNPVSRVFRFQNQSNDTINIRDILVSCGCTRIESFSKVLMPQQKDSIIMTFNPKGRPNGPQHLVADFWTYNQKRKWKQYMATLSGTVNIPSTPITPHYTIQANAQSQYKALQAKDTFEKILYKKAYDLIYNATLKLPDSDAKALEIHQIDSDTERLIATMRKGGYWEEIDYKCYFRTNWDPTTHIINLLNMVRSYSNENSRYYGNDDLHSLIDEALLYWVNANPRSHNWWHNQIGHCHPLTDVLIIMSRSAKGINPDTRHKLMNRLLKPDVHRQDGANKTDIASYQFYIACMKKDHELAKEMSEEIFYPVHITKKQGIQEDYSYHQHGTHLYIAGYGSVLLRGIVEMQYYLQGTPYSMSSEKLDIFNRFLDTYWDIYRGRCVDFNTTGRGLSRIGNLYNQIEKSLLEKCVQIKGLDTRKIRLVLQRYTRQKPASYKVENKNTNYWRSDYMLHNAPKYQASVNTASPRTRHTEGINGENLLGGNLSYGTLQIMCSGEEYLNIFPAWEWDKIPGVTAKKDFKPVRVGLDGTSPFTGGVSDGRHGAYAYEHNHEGIHALKSYFFTPDEVVALGSDITSQEDENIITTINQANLHGNTQYADAMNKVHTLKMGDICEIDNPKWIWHDQIGYVFPQGGQYTLKNTQQTANWATININGEDKDYQLPVFNLYCNHGQKPHQASYEYIMVPGCNQPENLSLYNNIKIVSNTTTCHAIRINSSKIVMANFYQPGTLNLTDGSIHVDKPCSIIIQPGKHKRCQVYIADVSQTMQHIAVTVSHSGKKQTRTIACDRGKTHIIDL